MAWQSRFVLGFGFFHLKWCLAWLILSFVGLPWLRTTEPFGTMGDLTTSLISTYGSLYWWGEIVMKIFLTYIESIETLKLHENICARIWSYILLFYHGDKIQGHNKTNNGFQKEIDQYRAEQINHTSAHGCSRASCEDIEPHFLCKSLGLVYV